MVPCKREGHSDGHTADLTKLGSSAGGAVANELGARAVFLFATFVSVLGIVGILWSRTVRSGASTPPKQQSAEVRKWTLLRRPVVYISSVGIFVVMFNWQGFSNTILPMYVNLELGFSLLLVELLLSCSSADQTLAMFAGGTFADRLGYKKVLATSMVLSMVSLALFPQLGKIEHLSILSVIYRVTVGIGLTLWVALSAKLATNDLGLAMGIYRTFMDLGGVLGPLTVTMVIETQGFGMSFLIVGVIMSLPLILLGKSMITQFEL